MKHSSNQDAAKATEISAPVAAVLKSAQEAVVSEQERSERSGDQHSYHMDAPAHEHHIDN